jgi:hypothetical protein
VIEYSTRGFIGRDTRWILNTANTTRRRSRCDVTATEREAPYNGRDESSKADGRSSTDRFMTPLRMVRVKVRHV